MSTLRSRRGRSNRRQSRRPCAAPSHLRHARPPTQSVRRSRCGRIGPDSDHPNTTHAPSNLSWWDLATAVRRPTDGLDIFTKQLARAIRKSDFDGERRREIACNDRHSASHAQYSHKRPILVERLLQIGWCESRHPRLNGQEHRRRIGRVESHHGLRSVDRSGGRLGKTLSHGKPRSPFLVGDRPHRQTIGPK